MKNIIYTFYEAPVDWEDDYGRVSLPRMREYAEKINADFKVVNFENLYPPIVKKVDKIFKEKKYPHQQWLHFWKCTVSSMFLHHEFLNSKYERMTVLDADIYITKHAKNIFEDQELKVGVSMLELDDTPYKKHMQHDINLFYGTEVEKCYYSPILVSDRESSSHLVENFLSDEEFLKAAESLWYVDEPRGMVNNEYVMENKKAPRIAAFMEQNLYTYIFHKLNMKVNPIDRTKWLLGARYVKDDDHNHRASMYHFPGPMKKLFFDEETIKAIDENY